MMEHASAYPSWVSVAGLIVSLCSLVLTCFIVPGGIYLMRAFIREEINVHDGREHAHPNLRIALGLEQKFDDLSASMGKAMSAIAAQIADLRVAVTASVALSATERRRELLETITAHEERENANQDRMLDEMKTLAATAAATAAVNATEARRSRK